VLLLEFGNGIESILINGGVPLDDDQTAPLALGQVGQRLRGRMRRVSVGGDDDVVGLGEIARQKTLPEASVRASDEDGSWWLFGLGDQVYDM